MELWQQIFASILSQGAPEIHFPQQPDLERIFSDQCYAALCEIKAILETEGDTDKDCFLKIEEVLRVYERMGVPCGTRHDF